MELFSLLIFTKLRKSLGLYLTNALSCDGKFGTDFLERVWTATTNAKAKLDNLLLSIGKSTDNLGKLLL